MRYLILLLSMFSSVVFSADYVWKIKTIDPNLPSSLVGTSYGSFVAACNAIYDAFDARYAATDYVSVRTYFKNNDTSYTCRATIKSKSSSATLTANYGTVERSGTQCPTGGAYNTSTGACDMPVAPDGTVCTPPSGGSGTWVFSGGVCTEVGNASQAAQCKFYAGNGQAQPKTLYWVYEGQGDTSTQLAGKDSMGCETTVLNPDLKKDCKYTPGFTQPAIPGAGEGGSDLPGYTQPGTYKCRFSATLTGNVAPNSSGIKPTDKLCDDPGSPRCALVELPKENEVKPCVYTTTSSGAQVCASSTKETKPGDTQCGYVGSAWTCKSDLPQAVGKGIVIATNVKTETTSDGKTKITKTDDRYETVCKGTPSSCSTSKTTSTTVTIKNGSGQTESTTGTCTGAACPDKNTNPDGDGDGFGDCTGDECTGEGGGLSTPELGEVDNYQQTTKKFYDRAKSAPLMSAVSGISAPSSGVAPDLVSSPIAALGGASLDLSSITQLMPILRDLLSYVMKAVWCFLAVVVLLSA